MRLLPLILFVALTHQAFCQDDIPHIEKLSNFPSKFIQRVDSKSAYVEEKIITGTQKYLHRLAKRESRLNRKLSRIDSTAAKNLIGNAEEEYAHLANSLNSNYNASKGEYLPYVDSIKTGLSFLLQRSPSGKINSSLARVQQMQSRLQDAEKVKQFIRQRRQQLKERLAQYTRLPKGISKDFERYNKEVYYYSQQINEYKELLNDPGKVEQKALSLLNKLPAFQQFMREHSELAGLFRLPDNYGSPQSLAGLQTRTQVQQLIQAQLSAAVPNAQQILQQNIQQAQQQLNKLKDKLNQLGGGSSDMEMPDFKPNPQRTKSFWKRLEYGTNLQSAKSNYFFPTTTDLGLSVGYKLSDKSVIGVGASYKMGWGKDIRHIDITHEGIGLRSFADVKLKGSFYASGGFEYNYQQPFQSLTQINSFNKWQQSGLAGISKVVALKSKVFKKTKLQLLWDFLSYRQTPRTQAIKFRVGYNF